MGAAPKINPDFQPNTDEKPPLRLVPGGAGAPRRDRWNALLTLIVLTGLVSVLHWNIRATQSPSSLSIFSIGALKTVYESQGLEAYVVKKRVLRNQVEQALSSKTAGPRSVARHIAVYLFPDLLSDDDMEKEVALERWAPIEKQLENPASEADPKSLFHSLELEIGTHENPKDNPAAWTEEARQTLELYRAFSRGPLSRNSKETQ